MGQRSIQEWVVVCVAVGVTALGISACLTNENPHDDEVSSFPLAGRHAAIPCESCHGDGAFGPLDPACESCHEAERPEGHYEGSCGNAGCHIPQGWAASGGVGVGDDDDDDIVGDDDDVPTGDDDDDVTTGDDDDVTTPGDDDDDDVTTGSDHEFLPLVGPHAIVCTECHPSFPDTPERLVCQDCHDGDRDGANHYVGQDCAHCHPVQAGWGGYDTHPFTLPHPDPAPGPVNDGCVNDPAPTPVELCISCHSDPTNRSGGDASCISCHAQTETDCRHANGKFPGYVYADASCKVCHPDGKN